MPRKLKSDVQSVLTLAGIQMQHMGVVEAADDEVNQELEGLDATDADLEGGGVGDILEVLGTGLIAWSQSLSGDGSRGGLGAYNEIPKSKDFFAVSMQWPDRWFRSMYRLSRPTFEKLARILRPMAMFQSTGPGRPQRPVEIQLACFLSRYGTRGCDTLRVAQTLSLGHGTVFLYCRRVCRALRELGLKHIVWPDEARKEVISNVHEEHSGFRKCLGSCDGSLIRLTEDPEDSHGVYRSRKKFPAINVQTTVDHQKRFTSYDLGWPGSVTDVTIFKASYIWNNRAAHFRPGEYLLADKGYPSSPYLVRPFNEPEIKACSHVEQRRRRRFNKRLSHVRIWVEHAFGMLKGRFPGLKEFGSTQDMQELYKVVTALMAVHNLCIDMDDHPEDIFDYDPTDDFTSPDGANEEQEDGDLIIETFGQPIVHRLQVPQRETDSWLRARGLAKRLRLLDELCPVEEFN